LGVVGVSKTLDLVIEAI